MTGGGPLDPGTTGRLAGEIADLAVEGANSSKPWPESKEQC